MAVYYVCDECGLMTHEECAKGWRVSVESKLHFCPKCPPSIREKPEQRAHRNGPP